MYKAENGQFYTFAKAFVTCPDCLSTMSAGKPLCKSCFGEINVNGFSVHGGQDVADRLQAATERIRQKAQR